MWKDLEIFTVSDIILFEQNTEKKDNKQRREKKIYKKRIVHVKLN